MASDSLKKWFDRNDGKGWVDCKTGKTCGRKKGEKNKANKNEVGTYMKKTKNKISENYVKADLKTVVKTM